MKLAKTLLIGLATISLVACSGYGKEVSRKEFVEEAQKCEKDNFTKAVLSYSLVEKTSGYKSMGLDDENIDLKGELKFSLQNGEFTLDANQNVPEELEGISEELNVRIQDAITDIPAEGSEAAKYYKFHTGPLGISFSASQSGSTDGGSGTTKISGYMEFEKHGLLVKMTSNISSSYTVKTDKTYKLSTSEKTSYTVTYQ